MPTIHFLTPDGRSIALQPQDGLSVMEAAVAGNVPGIDAECGGACACATCHVYIDEAWADRLPAKTDLEVGMLEFAARVEPTSRLSCRLVVGPDTDGLVMRIPASQH
jgi:2Fe-2S ferredoxin